MGVILRPKSVIKSRTMKTNFTRSLALLFIAFAAFSCSKKTTPKTNLEYLTQAIWKFHDAGLDADENGTVDQTDPDATPCKRDNTLDFNTDGSGIADEGATKCDDADPQSTDFDWIFKANESQLEYQNKTFNIIALNDNEIKAYYDVDMGGGMMFRYLIIMKH